ncbi:MAG TPA: CZB domain-containing protein [Holophagaceae bacterium]|nr:CZB domain-containing protein [Holophagaceae bacterium]
MNFEDAISAHQKWKTRLRMQIDGKATEVLDPAQVCKDDQCDLGQWIHAEGGRTMGSKPEFVEVKGTHAHFHKVAADVLKQVRTGDKAGASATLEGPFFEASSKVVQALMKCKKVCG